MIGQLASLSKFVTKDASIARMRWLALNIRPRPLALVTLHWTIADGAEICILTLFHVWGRV